MFRILGRLLLALGALLVLRIAFASARRANRGSGGPADPGVRRADPSRAPKGARAPRIDRSAAEDVPFVEVETEPEHARRG